MIAMFPLLLLFMFLSQETAAEEPYRKIEITGTEVKAGAKAAVCRETQTHAHLCRTPHDLGQQYPLCISMNRGADHAFARVA
jgi:hypothetical protein